MRLLAVVALVALLTACENATAPRYVLGPGCTWVLKIHDVGTVRAHYADCTGHNVDSLTALGWEIVWDTTRANHR